MRRMQLFFRLGSWMLILTATLHLVAVFAGRPAPANETEAELTRLLETYSKSFILFERTTMDFLQGFSLSFAILTFYVGVTNLVLMRVHHGRIKGLRILALMNTILCAVMFALSWAYFILQPLIGFGLCLLFFGLAFAAGQYQSEWERTASKMA